MPIMRIKVVTDSTCNLPYQLIEKHNISIVDLKIIIDGKVFKDSDIGLNEVVEAIKSNRDIKTSQPAVEDFMNVYKKVLEEYDHVISIHLSSKTSGTINAASLAAKTLNVEDRVTIFDSKLTSLAMGFIVLKACELIDKNLDINVIKKEIERYANSIEAYFLVGDLSSLVKGGRVSKLKGNIANFLKVKPIFTAIDGEIDIFKVTLGQKRGIAEMMKLVKERKDKLRDRLLGIVYLNTERIVEKFIKEFGNELKYFTVPTVPSLAVHAGTELFVIIMSLEG
ncbi:MAG TPA: DegV family protein [Thermotogaceae bacterium]|nr:DegV family protein [Thermotogaceae bacterium]